MKQLTLFVPHEVVYMALFLLPKFAWDPTISCVVLRYCFESLVAADVRVLVLLTCL